MPPLFYLTIYLLLLGAAAFALKLLAARMGRAARAGAAGSDAAAYQSAGPLLTPAERSFFGVLESAVAGRWRLMAKVRLADLVKVRPGLGASARQTAQNKINSKHLDFVLCRPDDLTVVAALELDDASHAAPSRVRRDEFVETALRAAGIPLLRFPARRAYTLQDVQTALQPLLTEPPPAPSPNGAPTCQACGAPMVLRTANKGDHAGKQFWGCSNFPKCKSTI